MDVKQRAYSWFKVMATFAIALALVGFLPCASHAATSLKVEPQSMTVAHETMKHGGHHHGVENNQHDCASFSSGADDRLADSFCGGICVSVTFPSIEFISGPDVTSEAFRWLEIRQNSFCAFGSHKPPKI